MDQKKNSQSKDHQNPQNQDKGLLKSQTKYSFLKLNRIDQLLAQQYQRQKSSTTGLQQLQIQLSDNEGDRPRKQTCIDKKQEIQKKSNQVENENEGPYESQEIDGQINQVQIISNQFYNKYQKYNQINCQIKEENQAISEVPINNIFNNQRQDIQQLPRVCLIENHDQRQIEFVCIYSECPLSRFLCNKCLRVGNHKHKQDNQNHILDNKELYVKLREKIQKIQSEKGININQLDILPTYPIKQIIYEILNRLNGIVNMIEQMEQGMRVDYNDQQLDEILRELKNNEFNQFDEKLLIRLINIDKSEDVIYSQLLEQSYTLQQNVIKIQDQINSELYLKQQVYKDMDLSINQDDDDRADDRSHEEQFIVEDKKQSELIKSNLIGVKDQTKQEFKQHQKIVPNFVQHLPKEQVQQITIIQEQQQKQNKVDQELKQMLKMPKTDNLLEKIKWDDQITYKRSIFDMYQGVQTTVRKFQLFIIPYHNIQKILFYYCSRYTFKMKDILIFNYKKEISIILISLQTQAMLTQSVIKGEFKNKCILVSEVPTSQIISNIEKFCTVQHNRCQTSLFVKYPFKVKGIASSYNLYAMKASTLFFVYNKVQNFNDFIDELRKKHKLLDLKSRQHSDNVVIINYDKGDSVFVIINFSEQNTLTYITKDYFETIGNINLAQLYLNEKEKLTIQRIKQLVLKMNRLDVGKIEWYTAKGHIPEETALEESVRFKEIFKAFGRQKLPVNDENCQEYQSDEQDESEDSEQNEL